MALFAVRVVAVQARLASNCGIFTVVKIGVVDPLPDAKKLNGVPVPQPVGDEEIAIFRSQHIRERNVILVVDRDDPDLRLDHADRFRHDFFPSFLPFFGTVTFTMVIVVLPKMSTTFRRRSLGCVEHACHFQRSNLLRAKRLQLVL